MAKGHLLIRWLSLAFLWSLLSTSLSAQDPESYFRRNCFSCHTIGGGYLTGPDLEGVTQRQSRDWLVNFMMNPQQVVSSGDPYVQELLQRARGVVMPQPPQMTRELAHAVLDFIEEESLKEESVFAKSQISDRPLTVQDIETGRALFLGLQRPNNGGSACIACHEVNGYDGFLGGGTLGLNLTNVFARLGGRQALAAWLSAPATPTMQVLFQDAPLTQEEILPLVAYFKHQAETNPPPRTAPFVNFLLFGLGGTAVLLVLFDLLWRGRFRAVRRPLVERIRRRVHSRKEETDLENRRTLYE